jgi:pimeloyl-ACP methyl ester carboxylesterase
MSGFTPLHRGGAGSPLVLLHGFLDTWRTWEGVLPALERHHDVLALTLAGHAGGPAIDGPVSDAVLVDAVERAMDAAGFETAHLAGNSLGGWVALQLAARGRARTVVALAPAGGWAADDPVRGQTLRFQATMHDALKDAPLYAMTDRALGVARADAAPAFIEYALSAEWSLDAERITCPVRIVWGTDDGLLPWPAAAVRFRRDWLPQADWIELDGVGHHPQLDIPLETAQLILGFMS